MTRPTNMSQPIPKLGTGFLGREAPNPITDPPDPIDRAAGRDVFVAPSDAAAAPVQHATGVGFGQVNCELGSTPTVGGLMTLAVISRGATTGITTPTGWTAPEGPLLATGNGGVFCYRVCDGTETWPLQILGDRMVWSMSEWVGAGTLDDSAETTGTSNPLTGATVDPTAGTEVLIIAAFLNITGDSAHTTSPSAGWTEIHDSNVHGDFGPHLWTTYQIVASASGSYTPAGTLSSAGVAYGAQTLAFGRARNPVQAGPNATDDDDATYVESSGTHILDIDLEEPRRIVRARLFVGTETAD